MHIITSTLESISWRAKEEGNGLDLNDLMDHPEDFIFSLSTTGEYDSDLTTLEVEGTLATNLIRFEVDMTEWLDQDGSVGMPIFSVLRGDEVQIRGGWNNWGDSDIMLRQPGTNIFSAPLL